MYVNIASGLAIVPATEVSVGDIRARGNYEIFNDATVAVAIPGPQSGSPSTQPYMGIIYAAVQDVYYGEAANLPVMACATGATAASPALPLLPANAIPLAHIYVPTGATGIVTANINGIAGAGNPDVYAFTPQRCVQMQGFRIGTAGTVTATATPGTTVPGMTINVWNPGGRNLKISFSTSFESSTVSVPEFYIFRNGAVISGTFWENATAINTFHTSSGFTIDSNQPAGLYQYTLQCWSNAADTVTFYSGGCFEVEDKGPV
jgi:hypothetical protein